jgi:hypothetical protein
LIGIELLNTLGEGRGYVVDLGSRRSVRPATRTADGWPTCFRRRTLDATDKTSPDFISSNTLRDWFKPLIPTSMWEKQPP